MPNALLERLRSEFADTRTRIEAIQNAAAEADRDLTESEAANVTEMLSRSEELRPRIDDLVRQEAGFAATADALATVRSAAVTHPEERSEAVLRSMFPSPGHYVRDLIYAHCNGDVPRRTDVDRRDAAARIARSQEITRALANQTTADNAGILPVPIVGDVINVLDASRPVFASFTSRPMPASGKTFQRPRITQHTQVAAQATEKSEVASQKMVIDSITLTKATYGGALDISVQDIDWTDPSILSIAIGDLGDQYAIATEAVASNVLDAVTQTIPAPVVPGGATPSDSKAWLTGLGQAASQVYNGGKAMPDRLWASVDVWAQMVALTAPDGRQVFPGLGPTNAAGSMSGVTSFAGNVLGLPLVVGPQLPAQTLIMGASKYAEAYEDRKGSIRAFEVNLLGWQVGYYGYACTVILQPTAFSHVIA